MSASDADRAKHEAREKLEEGKEKATEVKNDFIRRLKEDGVKNPKGLYTVGFGPVFVAAVPLTYFITKPGGVFEYAVNGLVAGVGLLASAGKTTAVPQAGKIAALSSLYLIATYAFGGAFSAAAIDAGNEEGRDNATPRKQVSNLTGLPLRLYSTASHTIETFAGFGLVAALAQAIAPTDQQLINLLGLHIVTKLFVYGPAYIFDVGPARTVSHIVATSAIAAVGLKLVNKPLL